MTKGRKLKQYHLRIHQYDIMKYIDDFQFNYEGQIPFTRVAMDLFGPLPTSSQNNKYILVIKGHV